MRRTPLPLAGAVLLAAFGVLGTRGAQALGDGADGRFEKRESSHFVLFQDVDIDESSGLRGSRRFEQQVLETLESAYTRVDASLGVRPRRKITVSIYDPGVFDARFAGLFRFPAAGFYGDSVHIRGATVMNQQLVRVLHHELVHAAFNAEAPSLVLPAWLNEGIAEWVEARSTGKRGLSASESAYLGRVAQAGQLFSLARLSSPSFAGYAANAAQVAYLQSYAFIEHLARVYGERRIRDFVREIFRTANLERAIRKSFRADLPDLEQAFARELGARG